MSQLCFVEQEEVCVTVGPDTMLPSISCLLLLSNILWRMVYRWAMREKEKSRDIGITLGH